jgi:RNA polymerase sigma-70 factor (ECF subfamily)
MSSTAPDDVTAYALAAKLGDRSAATAFISATRHDVRRFLAHLVSVQEADDLLQETYLRAMRSLPRFAGDSKALTWLLAIARRVAADHIRTLTRQPRTATGDDWQEVADRAGPRPRFEDAVALRHLVNELPPDRRFAFVATQVLGLSYAEAAEVCDVPVGTIRSRVARARDDLVQALKTGERPAHLDHHQASNQPPGNQQPGDKRHLRATS